MIWKSAVAAISGGFTFLALAAATSSAYAASGVPEVSICGSPVTASINAAGTAEAYRSFVGVWTGDWSRGRICAGLIVKKIDENGDAYIDYLYREAGPNSKNLHNDSIIGRMENNRMLTFNDRDGSRFTFTMRPEKDMAANFVNAGGTRLETVFQQAAHPSSSSLAESKPAQGTDIGSLKPGTYVDSRDQCSQAANATLMWFDGHQFNAGRFCPATLEPGQKGPVVTISRDNCPEEYGPDHPKMVRRVDTFSVLSPTEFLLKGQYGESRMRYCMQTELPATWRGTYDELQRGARETAQAAPTPTAPAPESQKPQAELLRKASETIIADETVITRDGRSILLKSDGTYSVVSGSEKPSQSQMEISLQRLYFDGYYCKLSVIFANKSDFRLQRIQLRLTWPSGVDVRLGDPDSMGGLPSVPAQSTELFDLWLYNINSWGRVTESRTACTRATGKPTLNVMTCQMDSTSEGACKRSVSLVDKR